MATWQQGINSGGFLAGIGTQMRMRQRQATLTQRGLIRRNNELARSGANNVGLTALRGLAGVADIYKQEQQRRKLLGRSIRFTLMHGLLVIHRDYLSWLEKSSVC